MLELYRPTDQDLHASESLRVPPSQCDTQEEGILERQLGPVVCVQALPAHVVMGTAALLGREEESEGERERREGE